MDAHVILKWWSTIIHIAFFKYIIYLLYFYADVIFENHYYYHNYHFTQMLSSNPEIDKLQGKLEAEQRRTQVLTFLSLGARACHSLGSGLSFSLLLGPIILIVARACHSHCCLGLSFSLLPI